MTLLIVGLGIALYALVNGASPASPPSVPAPQPEAEAPPPTTKPAKVKAPKQPAESPKPSPGSLAAPAAPLVLPRYPVGLELRFQGKKATIKQAWQDGQGGWHYKVDIDPGPWLPTIRNKAVSEQYMRDFVANQLKQPLAPDQAFPANVEIHLGGRGGLIESVAKSAEGLWLYAVRGMGQLTQGQLLDKLVKA